MHLDDETIQASGGHLFWVSGAGFTKTRELRVGQALQTARGEPVTIRAIEASGAQPLYNLVVDGQANYFVGAHQVLSHDSTILSRGEPSVEQENGRQQAVELTAPIPEVD